MGEGTVHDPPVSRRKIIERPRLTRLLDESPARIKLLVAPAGYGKTTLARQWLHQKERSGWFTCGPERADVASLARKITAGASAVVGEQRAAETLTQVASFDDPAREVDVISEIVSSLLSTWPDDAWLMVDDYHTVGESAVADLFLRTVLETRQLRVVLCSRRRPSWATARRVLYGEILELNRFDLAMTAEEASLLVGSADLPAEQVVEQSRGWPALLGLTAVLGTRAAAGPGARAVAHNFFFEEILGSLTRPAQDAVTVLGLAARIPIPIAEEVTGDEGGAVIAEGIGAGLFEATSSHLEIHPLVQEYLVTRVQRVQHPPEVYALAQALLAALSRAHDWDASFLIVERLLPDHFEDLLRSAAYDLLANARIQTLQHWLEFGRERQVSGVVAELTAAELALRDGLYVDALIKAESVLQRPIDVPDVLTRVLILAGRSAHLASLESRALHYYREALKVAKDESLRREAIRGEVMATIELEAPEAESLIDAMERVSHELDDIVDVAEKRLLLDSRRGTVRSLDRARGLVPAAKRIADPLRRCSFLNTYASHLTTAADYAAGLEACDTLLADARASRLDFVRSYGLASRALCLAGQRDYTSAIECILEARESARHHHDTHSLQNCEAIESRIRFATGDFDDALAALRTTPQNSVASMASEFMACRAIALSALGRVDEATADATRASALSGAIETRVLVPGARAVAAVRSDPSAAAGAVRHLVQEAVASGNLDCLVTLYRGVPELIGHAPRETLEALLPLLRQLGDHALAQFGRALEERTRGGLASLTPRETEVAALLAQGLSNREIAAKLFVSPGTAKLHVRHIFEKLNVSSRTAAALKIAAAEWHFTQRTDSEA